MSKSYKNPVNILVRGTNWVGDAVMTLPALNALADNFSESKYYGENRADCRLTVLTRPWAAPVYEHQSAVNRVLLHDRDGAHKGLGGRLRLVRELAAEKFDCAVLFQNAFEAALVTALARIPQRVGYARDGRGFLLTNPLILHETDRHIHESFYYLKILERMGLKAPFSRPRMAPAPVAMAEADSILKDKVGAGDFLLALAPGAAFGSAKRWPVENFARAAELILAKYSGRVMIMGGPGEMDVATQLAELLEQTNPGAALNLAGRVPMGVSVALMSRADLLVTNDSGLMHIGGALDVPLVAAFGPTNPLTTAPLSPSRLLRSAAPCSPCLKRECPLPGGRICFDDVTPEMAAEAAFDLISPPAPPAGAMPAVFLDRDGTINREVEYLSSPKQLELLPGAGAAIAALNRAGWKVVVTTNQSGVARGYFSEETLEDIHKRLKKMLGKEGAALDGIYYCPHHKDGSSPHLAIDCDCRKPESGMAERAARELNLDLSRSVWVGDRLNDLKAAEKFKGRSVLVMTGYGLKEVSGRLSTQPTLVAPDLKRAAEWILS
ncbi:hypothetical protein C4J81_04725 [Deltaproteobacteria bacterium Smac51]|nr:hypothetical protein C4J81_04725 [Deltaproteobacteria bacterium Smac51]